MADGIATPPNEAEFSSNKASNGFLPLTRMASNVDPSNLSRFMHGDPGGSADLAKMGSPMNPPNAGQFAGGDKGMTPVPPSAVEPGKGAVPVNPFLVSGALVPSSQLRDSAKK